VRKKDGFGSLKRPMTQELGAGVATQAVVPNDSKVLNELESLVTVDSLADAPTHSTVSAHSLSCRFTFQVH
jgi:hypothetical protein